MPSADRVLAILCSDVHLSHKPPIGRSAEDSWYSAMARQLDQLSDMQQKYKCPVICAGDLFDKWNAPAELINFAIENLSADFYAIPGQHDLPNHRMEDVNRSAFWTLVSAKTIKQLDPHGTHLNGVYFVPFPWGVDVEPMPYEGRKIAVVHAYCWKRRAGSYPGAPEDNHFNQWKKRLSGYDGAVFGDNHVSFYDEQANIFNCGTFMRRKSDDPWDTYVGLLLKSGKIRPVKLDNSQDRWIHSADDVAGVERDWDMHEFVEELSRLSSNEFDFASCVRRFCRDNEIKQRTKQVIMEALGDT